MGKRQIRLFLLITGGVLFLSICAGAWFTWFLEQYSVTPADPAGKPVIFSIQRGETLSRIALNLEKQGLIKQSDLFRHLVRFNGYATRLQAGEYSLSPSMPPNEIITCISSGKVKLHRLTLPEGLTIEETALAVENAGFGIKEAFISLARDGSFATSLGIAGDTMEGYLYPETYFFPADAGHETIIRTLFDRFQKVFTLEWKKRAHELGFSVHEIVTLASIIEKETGVASERPVIACVFHNRLKKRMRLESDPTVIYGIQGFNGNITKKDLLTLTPYNTYKISGLPPGPIASPGEASLRAALFPEKTEYLYFVSKNDGTHYFSKTFQEHDQAVKKYQLRRNK